MPPTAPTDSKQPFSAEMKRPFSEILLKRRHWKWFDPSRKVPDATLREIIELSRRAPTSFNAQPYKVVLVQSREAKKNLGCAMLSPLNKEIVEKASLSAVFFANTQIIGEIPKLQSLFRKTTTAPQEYIDGHLPKGLMVLSQGWTWAITRYALSPFLRLVVGVATRMMGIIGCKKPLPLLHEPTAWAFKQTAFAIDHFVLAATAAGLRTAVMEGFGSEAVCLVLNAPPSKWVPCAMVAIGYAAPGAETKESRSYSERYPVEEVWYNIDSM
uniref:Nitroreductase domain-containing protein n=1 Tax=Lotharella oceanica TaxID=641309 RepID=A0A7S2X9S8_9EUKA|mmetsp:Transcript_16612/g.31491  ORF Transcript_16612/g.31491 Transcript_16612/m.31491 type:complete len:270 (+) Transcript_16612:88-897(+)